MKQRKQKFENGKSHDPIAPDPKRHPPMWASSDDVIRAAVKTDDADFGIALVKKAGALTRVAYRDGRGRWMDTTVYTSRITELSEVSK